MANLSRDVFYNKQIWRLFTAEFVTFSAIDCIFALFFAYTSIGRFVRDVLIIGKKSGINSLHCRLYPDWIIAGSNMLIIEFHRESNCRCGSSSISLNQA